MSRILSTGEGSTWAGTPLDQVHPLRTRYTPLGPGTPPTGAVHAGRYGQQAGGTHPTGMHSCVNIMYRHEVTVESDIRFENCKEICNLTEQKFQCIGNVLSFTPALKFSSTCSIVWTVVRKSKENRSGAILFVCITTDIMQTLTLIQTSNKDH